MKGGGVSYNSAQAWTEANYGNMDSQVMRTFGSPNQTGNFLEPIPGAPTTLPYTGFKGGRRRKHRGKRKSMKGGGFWSLGSVLNTAAVPFTLFGLQHYMGSRKGKKHPKKQSRFTRDTPLFQSKRRPQRTPFQSKRRPQFKSRKAKYQFR